MYKFILYYYLIFKKPKVIYQNGTITFILRKKPKVMDTTEINIWEHYNKEPETRSSLVERLREAGPKEGPNGVVMGKFPSWQDAHIAADTIEHLERRIAEYEETIRYLTLQVTKTL